MKKLTFECKHEDIGDFADLVLDGVKSISEECNLQINDSNFRKMGISLEENCLVLGNCLDVDRKLSVIRAKRSLYGLKPFTNYLLGMRTDTLDINVWYYDRSDYDYKPDYDMYVLSRIQDLMSYI